jgi:hypothetical protein
MFSCRYAFPPSSPLSEGDGDEPATWNLWSRVEMGLEGGGSLRELVKALEAKLGMEVSVLSKGRYGPR